jgi:hypothetical protein
LSETEIYRIKELTEFFCQIRIFRIRELTESKKQIREILKIRLIPVQTKALAIVADTGLAPKAMCAYERKAPPAGNAIIG